METGILLASLRKISERSDSWAAETITPRPSLCSLSTNRVRRLGDRVMLVATSLQSSFHPLCQEKMRLCTLHQLAVDLHATAVDEVLIARGRASKQAYETFLAAADEARNARNAARIALERHKHEHGC
jgi:hypothetical protein